MFKYLFKRDTILATVMVFLVIGLLAIIPVNTHVLDPIELALEDFDYNDMAYSQFNKNSHTSVDTGIVIIHIGNAGRAEIAAIMEKALSENPGVVGADVLFNAPKEDAAADSNLHRLFAGPGKLVMAYDLSIENGKAEPHGFLFDKARQKGFANFVGEEGGTIRFFAPSFKDGKEHYRSFAAEVIRVAYPEQFEKLASRNHNTEQVNYTRSTDKFIVMNGEDYLQNTESSPSLTGKIVLVGYVAPGENNVEDKHFTRLNKKSVGKSIPDMAGLFIHANIISMLKDGDYIHKTPVWVNWLIAFLLCWLSMSLYIRDYIDEHIWFHLLAKCAQLLSAILFIYFGLLLYFKWDVDINFTPTLVAIILAVDVLYFYEGITNWMHKRFGYRSLFKNAHH